MRSSLAVGYSVWLWACAAQAAGLPLEQRLPGTVWTYPAAKAEEDQAKIQFLKDGQLRLGWNLAAPLSTFHWKLIAPDTVELHPEVDHRRTATLKVDADFLEATLTADGRTHLADNVTTPGAANLLAMLTPKAVAKLAENWGFEHNVLSGPQRRPSVISLPGDYPRNDYVIHLRLRNTVRRSPCFMVLFPIGEAERVGGLAMDTMGRVGPHAPMEPLTYFANRRRDTEAADTLRGRMFSDDATRKLEIAVSRAGDRIALVCRLDGKLFYHTTCSAAELRGGPDPRLAAAARDQIGFLTYDSDWEISSVRVTALGAEEKAAMQDAAGKPPEVGAEPGDAARSSGQFLPAWCSREVPKPGPTGWITLFDGKALHGLNENFESREFARSEFELKEDGLHLDGSLHFAVNARDAVIRARVSGGFWELRLRTLTDPAKGRRRGYALAVARRPGTGEIRLIDDEHREIKDLKPFSRDGTPEAGDYEFTAAGDRLTARVEGNTVADVRDATFEEGGMTFFATRPVVVKRIEIKILDARKP